MSKLTTDELLAELEKVHASLKALESGQEVVTPVSEETKPTLTIKEAFKKNEVICMVCGKGGFKTLTRHLKQAHELKPGQYKKQFGIPGKQSLAAKSFSEARRKSALDRGLGDNLAKAREVRAANIAAKKAAPAKVAKVAKGKAVKKK